MATTASRTGRLGYGGSSEFIAPVPQGWGCSAWSDREWFLEEADVVVRVYALHGQQTQLKAQMQVPYVRLEVVEQGMRVHVHPDGTQHVHNEATDGRGFYVTPVTFERPGPWGFEVLAKQGDGPVAVSRFTINVLAAPSTPEPGTPAPRSHKLIASDVPDLHQIDTSDPPDPRPPQVRIADAIAQGKPQVIVFATPKFCTSRVCGPVVATVRTLLATYGDGNRRRYRLCCRGTHDAMAS